MLLFIFPTVFIKGSTDGRIHCWNTETGAKVAVMSCDHPGPVQCCQFNPKYMMLATSCTNMVSVITSLGDLAKWHSRKYVFLKTPASKQNK